MLLINSVHRLGAHLPKCRMDQYDQSLGRYIPAGDVLRLAPNHDYLHLRYLVYPRLSHYYGFLERKIFMAKVKDVHNDSKNFDEMRSVPSTRLIGCLV